jgi:hypothetical protein
MPHPEQTPRSVALKQMVIIDTPYTLKSGAVSPNDPGTQTALRIDMHSPARPDLTMGDELPSPCVPKGNKPLDAYPGEDLCPAVVEAGRKRIGLVLDNRIVKNKVVVKSPEISLHKAGGDGSDNPEGGHFALIVDLTVLAELNLFRLCIQPRRRGAADLQPWPFSQPDPQ